MLIVNEPGSHVSTERSGQPGARVSWVPRAHPLSWVTLAVTTCAILMTAVAGEILPAVLPEIQRSGVLAATVQGVIIESFGYTVHYVVLAAICLLGLVPLARMTETVPVRRKHV